ncbi:carboxymuconolactone decarboxylase family protein [Woeseia oceani]|uniref:Peroxidase n=1 Tax=Woeseia oceani TaxID=1548547 RepID=A0A193LDA5_9GAMM|nr:carboxymuconolactone decarboxylase family protein [Woeseia oceani]ANO50510.1 peroxidase [Woeseia oceani]
MPVVEPLDEEQIEPALREYVQFFKGPLGVVPNSVRTMSRRPNIAKAFTDLNVAVMECAGAVTPEFKRLIGYVTSMVSGCRYCQAHTILGSERFGTSEDRLNSIFNYADSPHFTTAEKAALDFAFAAAEVPNGVTEDHAEKLRAHWSDEDIVEIMGVIALFGYLNRWNDSMGSALEDLPTQAGEKYLGKTGWTVGKHR